MKSVTRNKFLLCCRPVVLDMDRPAGRAITYIAGVNSDGEKLPARKPGGGFLADLGEPVATCPPKRTLSRVIRAVLFEVMLSKSVRDKKGLRSSKRHKLLSREGSSSSCSSYGSDENKTEDVVDLETKSNPVAAESCSGTESRNRSKYLRRKSSQSVAAKQCLNSGMFLFLISLTITVLWGKLWAILLTSLWSYFLPLPGGVAGNWRPETVAARFGKGSYYEKKVIMEK